METKNTLQIKSIELDKFRCFDHHKIEAFGKDVTILIGKNGVGKTTLLNAIKMGLSFIFADNKKIKSITNGVKGVRIAQFNNLDGHYSYSNREYQYPLSIKMNGEYQNSDLPEWILGKASEGGALLSTRYQTALLQFHKTYAKNKVLPLLAYYSDSYPHIGTKISSYAKDILKSGRPIPREFGYYQWSTDTSCSEIWETRWLNAFENYNSKYAAISNFEKQSQEINRQIELENSRSNKYNDIENLEWLKKNLDEITANIITYKNDAEAWNIEKEYVLNLINKFIATDNESMPIKDIYLDYRADKAVIVLRYKDGSQRTFQELPAGYRRLLSIVLDISYRAFLFTQGEYEPSGIVLIDEIDLHLHPSLEQNVVERFKRTFPNIQFIITTHSPLVISNFKQDENNKIIVMKEEDGQYSNGELTDIYGIGYDVTVSQVMKTPVRNSDIEYLIDTYVRFKRRNKIEDANLVLQKLKEETGRSFERISNEINQRLKEE